jgi:nucleoside phosphorylase
VQVVAGGGDADRLERELEQGAPHASALISIGLAGALAEGLKPGDWVVGTRVLRFPLSPGPDGQRIGQATDPSWAASLLASLPGARAGAVLGSDVILADGQAKRLAHQASGAVIVDMESHVAAAVATRHGLAFAVARVVSDAADRSLPKAAQAGMAGDGSMDIFAVLKSLTADPRQLAALIRVGADAETAFRALGRRRDLLGPGLGRPDLGELPLDVA